MKTLLLFLTLSALPFAGAQSFYVGGGGMLLAGVALSDPRLETLLLPSVQLGGAVTPDFGLRLTVETNLTFETGLTTTLIGADALYLFSPVGPATTVYVGGGPDLVITPFFGSSLVLPSLHGTLGLEYRLEVFGLFAEVQPQIVPLIIGVFLTKVRAGVNLHF
jgi:hypothetical protein